MTNRSRHAIIFGGPVVTGRAKGRWAWAAAGPLDEQRLAI